MSSPPPPPPPLTTKGKKSKDDEEIIRLALRRSAYFSNLDEEQVDRFVQAAQLRKYAPGETVVLYESAKEDDGITTTTVDNEIQDNIDDDFVMINTADAAELILEANEDADHDTQDKQKADEPAPTKGTNNKVTEEDIFEDGDAYASLDAVAPGEDEKLQVVDNFEQPPDHADVTAASDMANEEADIVQEQKPTLSSGEEQLSEERYVFAVRSGAVDLWRHGVKVGSKGPTTMLGEESFLIHHEPDATLVASDEEGLQCWEVPATTFYDKVLPSEEKIQIFAEFANALDGDGNPCMEPKDFFNSCAQVEGDPNAHIRVSNTYNMLFQNVGMQHISVNDFCLLHMLMAMPDPEVDIAFLAIDRSRSGRIELEDVQTFLETTGQRKLQLSSDFVQRHFGKDASLSLKPSSFSQFLHDFKHEIGRQAFQNALEETGTSGRLPPSVFFELVASSCTLQLPSGIIQRLDSLRFEASQAVDQILEPSQTLSYDYSDLLAYQEVLNQLPTICNLIHGGCKIKKGPISQDDFKVVSRVVGFANTLTRRQVEIVFQLFDLNGDDLISIDDFKTVVGADFVYRLKAFLNQDGKISFTPRADLFSGNLNAQDTRNRKKDTRTSPDRVERFNEDLVEYTTNYFGHLGIGAAAGAIGATVGLVLAPLDLVKTRLQQQRIRPYGVGLYSGAWDCLTRAYRTEGMFALFRGNVPYFMSIVPQRAFQLTVYEQMCGTFATVNPVSGETVASLPVQALAGGVAGACQVFFANPLELAKVELQTQGEIARLLKARGQKVPPAPSFVSIANELARGGFLQGASSCLFRDIPFSAMFFPLYSFLRQSFKQVDTFGPIGNVFLAASLAAIPPSILVTPADVIKTRLQAPPRDIAYKDFRHCATHMYRFEGLKAFFAGAGLRALRIAPQLGLTMAAYEALPAFLNLQQASSSSNSSTTSNVATRNSRPANSIIMARTTMRQSDSRYERNTERSATHQPHDDDDDGVIAIDDDDVHTSR